MIRNLYVMWIFVGRRHERLHPLTRIPVMHGRSLAQQRRYVAYISEKKCMAE